MYCWFWRPKMFQTNCQVVNALNIRWQRSFHEQQILKKLTSLRAGLKPGLFSTWLEKNYSIFFSVEYLSSNSTVKKLSSHGGLEVELWTDNILPVVSIVCFGFLFCAFWPTGVCYFSSLAFSLWRHRFQINMNRQAFLEWQQERHKIVWASRLIKWLTEQHGEKIKWMLFVTCNV